MATPYVDRAKALISEAAYLAGAGKEGEVPEILITSFLLIAAAMPDPKAFLRLMIEELERAIATMPAEVAVGNMGKGT